MDRNTKISIISVCMDEEHERSFFNDLTEILQKAFIKKSFIKVQTCTNIKSVENLKEKIITENTVNAIFVFGAHSLKNTIIEEINKVSDAKTEIVKNFAKIPILLKRSFSEFLHCSCRKNTLIYCLTGNETEILKNIKQSVNSMVLAVWLLQNVLTICNKCNHLHKMREDQMLISISPKSIDLSSSKSIDSISLKSIDLSSSKSIDSISPKSTDSTSPKSTDLTSPKSTDSTSSSSLQMNEADISTLPNQMGNTVSADVALLIIKTTLKIKKTLLQIETVNIKDAFGRRIYKDATIIHTKQETYKIEDKLNESCQNSPDKLDIMKWVNSGQFTCDATAAISADNVVRSDDDERNKIETLHKIKYQQNNQFLGSDVENGEIIIQPSIRMGSMEIGLLAACGLEQVNVIKETSIGILTIRDKLQEPGEPLKPEHSYDNCRTILILLLKENGFNSSDFGITAKISMTIKQKIEEALETVDLLVTIGCSRDEDCLKTILKNDFNAILHFANVNIKPGKSTAFASCNFKGKTKYILCLPGKAVSVLVTAHLFLLPLVKWLHNSFHDNFITVMAKIEQELSLHSRPRYVWATLSWSMENNFAQVICREGNSINNNLSNIIGANALLILPAKTPEIDTLKASSFVSAMLIKFSFLYKNNVN